jgi:hypothetical protein
VRSPAGGAVGRREGLAREAVEQVKLKTGSQRSEPSSTGGAGE